MKTVIVTFSSRSDGNCSQIGKLIASVSKDPVLFDFSTFDIHPCGRCAAECFAEREACPFYADKEKEILEAILQSGMVYFVLPNYCDYPNANFFIFNERSQCFFQGRPEMLELYLDVPKRGIVVSSTNKDNFIQALAYHFNSEPEILFLSAKEYGKNSIRGDLLESEEAQKDIRQFIGKPLKKHETTELTEEKKMNILIETDRLFTTEMTMDMAMDVQKNSLDEDIRRFVPDEVFETPEDAKETVEFLMSQYGSSDGPQVYAVILKDGEKNIGYVQLVPLGEGRWEIGYHVAKPYTQKGYATEAVTAFLPVMAEKVGINEVYGIRLLENAASGRVLDKCGFKTFFVGKDRYHDGIYEISKSVWKL